MGDDETPMKTAMLFAGALALLLAGPAVAKKSAAPGAQAHKSHRTKTVRAARQPAMPPRDPYAEYWKDPSRQAPPFSWGGPKGGG